MQIIITTNSYCTQVSDEDYEYLNQWNWQYNINAGVQRCEWDGGLNYTVYMASVILDRQNILHPETVDHTDRNNLNNQRYNLRSATQQQNICNRSIQGNNTSGLIGVSFNKQHQKWLARIQVKHKPIFLGLYSTKEEAARVRDSAAKYYHGEFAVLNFED